MRELDADSLPVDVSKVRCSAYQFVLQAFVHVVGQHGGKNEDDSDAYIRELEKQRRYLLDTWS